MSAAEPTPAVAATVELDGVRLFTRRAGDGPPVVVLHGGPGAHHDYLLPQYDLLARALAVAPYFRDPNLAKQMTPFRVTARTQDAVWASLGDYDLRPRLAETGARSPVPRSLVVHGIYDPMPLDGARELAALLRTGVLELATGHAPHVEATQDFVRALDRFLPRA